jgi:hypothetical protein
MKNLAQYEQVLAATDVDREWNCEFLGIGKSEWIIAMGLRGAG